MGATDIGGFWGDAARAVFDPMGHIIGKPAAKKSASVMATEPNAWDTQMGFYEEATKQAEAQAALLGQQAGQVGGAIRGQIDPQAALMRRQAAEAAAASTRSGATPGGIGARGNFITAHTQGAANEAAFRAAQERMATESTMAAQEKAGLAGLEATLLKQQMFSGLDAQKQQKMDYIDSMVTAIMQESEGLFTKGGPAAQDKINELKSRFPEMADYIDMKAAGSGTTSGGLVGGILGEGKNVASSVVGNIF